jgi:hypothetical protein
MSDARPIQELDAGAVPPVRLAPAWVMAAALFVAATALVGGAALARAAHTARGALLQPYPAGKLGIAFSYPVYSDVSLFGAGPDRSASVSPAGSVTRSQYESATTRYDKAITFFVTRSPVFDPDATFADDRTRCTTGSSDAPDDTATAVRATYERRRVHGMRAGVCRRALHYRGDPPDRLQQVVVLRALRDRTTSYTFQLITSGERLSDVQRATIDGIIDSVRRP